MNGTITLRSINYATISRKDVGAVGGGWCDSDVGFCENAREISPQSSQRTQSSLAERRRWNKAEGLMTQRVPKEAKPLGDGIKQKMFDDAEGTRGGRVEARAASLGIVFSHRVVNPRG